MHALLCICETPGHVYIFQCIKVPMVWYIFACNHMQLNTRALICSHPHKLIYPLIQMRIKIQHLFHSE